MLRNPYQQYRATRVETSGSVDLVVMLYQGAVKFIRVGLEALDQQDTKEAHECFVRAQDIVVELLGSLNREAGGDIAQQLAGLYDYCYRQLILANVKKIPRPRMKSSASCAISGRPGSRLPASSASRPRRAASHMLSVAPGPPMAAIAV